MSPRNRRQIWSSFFSKPQDWSALSGPGDTGSASEARWMLASRQAMGTYFEIRLSAFTLMGVPLAERCFDQIDSLEMQMTIYRDDSEIASLNAAFENHPVSIEPRLYDLLKLAKAIHLGTDGAYDITTGALSRAWGFVKGPKRVPSADEITKALRQTGMRHLLFDDAKTTIASTCPGLEINLGSIGKGYAIDRVVELIRQHPWPTSAMVHGGRSSLYALGHQVGSFFEPWRIALHNPVDPANPLVELLLSNQAVGTSGGTFQSFVDDGKVYGHIIDPRTGIPPVGPLSVTVIAPTAAEADALSTAFYLTGPRVAWRMIQNRADVAAIFLRRAADDQESDVEILVLNSSPGQVVSHLVRPLFIQGGQDIPPEWQ
ncbi:MAG: FAD:protein FMN transferase [bacterium]